MKRRILCSLVLAFVFVMYGFGHASADWNVPWPDGTFRDLQTHGDYDGPAHTRKANYALDWNVGSGNSDCGLPVTSIAIGTVRRSACSGKLSDTGYGCHLEVLHGPDDYGDARSFYAHLRERSGFERHSPVCQGSFIGVIGRTRGDAMRDDPGFTCHLHFHMMKNGAREALLPEPLRRSLGPVPFACPGQIDIDGPVLGWHSCTTFACP